MQNVLYIVVGIWLILLSLVVGYIFSQFSRLTKGVKQGDLIKILKKVFDTEEKNKKSIVALIKEIKRIDEEKLSSVQKVGLVRFNPFRELGGDHSFAIALLDGKNTGIILTGLHTRERTRVYIKEVNKGVSKLSLSKEEEKAIKNALGKGN